VEEQTWPRSAPDPDSGCGHPEVFQAAAIPGMGWAAPLNSHRTVVRFHPMALLDEWVRNGRPRPR